MIKFYLNKYINVSEIQILLNMFRTFTGITVAFALQRTLQDEDDYSNEFCKDCIKKSSKGKELCTKCFSEYVKEISNTKEFTEFHCHVDLIDFVAPIKVHDELATFLVAGQIIDKPHDFEKARLYATQLGIDEEKYIEAYKKVRYLNPEQKKIAIDLIKGLASYVSTRATERYDKMHQQNIEILTNFVLDGIDTSLRLEELLHVVSKELAELFKVSSVKVFSFNKKLKTFNSLASYKTGNNVPDLTITYDNRKYVEKFMDYWCEIVEQEAENKRVKFYDFEKNKDLPDVIKRMYTDAGIFNCACLKILKTEDTYTILVLLSSESSREWSASDTKFLELIAKQISIALKQKSLNDKLDKNKELERNILDILNFPVWIKDIEGNYIALNKDFCKYYNVKNKDEILGRSVDNIHQPSIEIKIKNAENFVKTSLETKIIENVKEVGKEKMVDIHISPACLKDGTVFGTIGYIV